MSRNPLVPAGKLLLVIPVLVGLLVSSAWGHSDVFLANVGGKVAVGGANELFEPGENFDLTTKVFEGVMYANFPPLADEYGRDEPGIFALASGSGSFPAGASALPATAAVTVNLSSFSLGGPSDTLFYWNGTGAIDFQPISTAQPGVTFALDPDPLGTTDANGSLHEHPVYALNKAGGGAGRRRLSRLPNSEHSGARHVAAVLYVVLGRRAAGG